MQPVKSVLFENEPYCFYKDIQNLLYIICDYHKELSKKWIDSQNGHIYNLRRYEVRNVSTVIEEQGVFLLKNEFYHYIKDYA